MSNDNGRPEQRMTAIEWWALIFMVCCILALVVVYLDINVWRK